MAYTTIQVTINGVAKAAIDVTGDGTQVIIEETLSDLDKANMDIVSASTGATFAAKLAATTLSNGITADVLYADFIKVTADLDALYASAQMSLGSLSARIDDHEDRIVALETAP